MKPRPTEQQYQVITLTIPASKADFIQGVLYEYACLGLIEEDAPAEHKRLKAYFPADEQITSRLQAIQAHVANGACESTLIRLNASDFKPAPFEPVQLAGEYWIVPPEDMMECGSWIVDRKDIDHASRFTLHDSQSEDKRIPPETSIVIRPGMAFGTGRHETTQLCAEAMLSLDPNPMSLLDVGTGSGVLAILAKKIGIQKVCAVEISADARANARENFRLNGITDIELDADIRDVGAGFHVVVANILTPTLLNLKNTLCSHLASGGFLILSGITNDEVKKIETAFRNLTQVCQSEKNGWYCFVYRS